MRDPNDGLDQRRCRTCHRDLPLSRFSTYDNGKGPRYRRKCRDCRNEYQRQIRGNDGKAPERPEITEKLCRDCGQVKPMADFPRQRSSSGNFVRGAICRPCRARRSRDWNATHSRGKALNRNLLQTFGITLNEFNALLDIQGGVCKICGRPPENTNQRNWRLHVDHCHGCDAVRSLLCSNCNNGLGCFRDDPKLLQAAIEYLSKHSCKPPI